MGMILIIPLPQILQTITITIAIIAISQLFVQLLIADCERLRPIAIMIGPVTIGGKNLITLLVPNALMKAANTRYKIPAHATPKQA